MRTSPTKPTVAPAAPLAASLASEPPDPVEVGKGTVLHLAGHCDPAVRRDSVEVELAGRRTKALAAGMGPPGTLGPGDLWWALVELEEGFPEGEHEVTLHARKGRDALAATIGSVRVVERDHALAPPAPSFTPGDAEHPLIAICMATYEPQIDHVREQIDSIRAQEWPSWVCVISDDASSQGAYSGLLELIGDDERFIVSRSERNLGFYRNFERAIRMAPAEARFLTLADQDDRWYPDKLSSTYRALQARPDSLLGYTDMKVVDEQSGLVSDTYWYLRRNCYDDMGSMLVANTVTGAASLFRAELLDCALPFPATVGEPYHDHWLALCALALGEITYLDRPTYEHVRHASSVTVQARGAWPLRPGRYKGMRLLTRLRLTRSRLRLRPGWRSIYFNRYLQVVQLARTLELRTAGRLKAAKRRPLRRVIDAPRSPLGAGWLAARSLRHYVGWNETLARERVLLGGVLWRRLAGIGARLGRAPRRSSSA